MPVPLDKILDDMEVPKHLRDRKQYVDIAKILQQLHEALKDCKTVYPNTKKMPDGSFKDTVTYTYPASNFFSQFRGIHQGLPASPGPLLDAVLAFKPEVTASMLKDGLDPVHLPPAQGDGPSGSFDNGSRLGAVAADCPCELQGVSSADLSDDFRQFTADVWGSRDPIMLWVDPEIDPPQPPGTAANISNRIYHYHYTHPSHEVGPLTDPEVAYLSSLNRLEQDTGKAHTKPLKPIPDILTAEQKNREKGLATTYFEYGSASGIQSRIYVHTTKASTINVMRTVLTLMDQMKGIPAGKVAGPRDAGTREDTIVVYAQSDEAARAFATELQQRVDAACFLEGAPGMTDKVGKGIGIGADPEPGTSFGQHRSGIVGDAFYDVMMRCPNPTLAQFQQTVAAFFRFNNLAPARPFDPPARLEPLIPISSSAPPLSSPQQGSLVQRPFRPSPGKTNDPIPPLTTTTSTLDPLPTTSRPPNKALPPVPRRPPLPGSPPPMPSTPPEKPVEKGPRPGVSLASNPQHAATSLKLGSLVGKLPPPPQGSGTPHKKDTAPAQDDIETPPDVSDDTKKKASIFSKFFRGKKGDDDKKG